MKNYNQIKCSSYTGRTNDANGIGKVVFSIAGALLIITVISGMILTSATSFAATNAADSSAVSVTVNSACTLYGGSSGTSTSGASTYSATVDPGTSTTISGSKLVTVCNDTSGYSLYAIGYGNDTAGTTSMIGTSTNISTGTSGTSSSWWGMYLEAASGVTPPTILNSFDSLHVVPSDYTQIAKYTAATASSTSTGAAVQTKYQVYVSSDQAAGTYTGKVKYTMVHPNDAAAPSTKTIADATYMQEVGECPSSLTTEQVYTLTDSRDSQTYYVAKLKDGNCWMLQNLKLGKSTSTLDLTPSTSDVGSTFTLDGKLSDGRFTYSTVDGVEYQNNNSQYYCTDNYGCYYNWYTATAGTGTTWVSSGSVDNSICPAGWTLPTQSQFSTLYANYNSAALMLVDDTTQTENSNGEVPGFLLGGSYDSSGIFNSSHGYYWSRTASTIQVSGYALDLSGSSVTSAGNNRKYRGFAVRCVIAQ